MGQNEFQVTRRDDGPPVGSSVGDCELNGGSTYRASDDMLQECCEVIKQTVEQDCVMQRDGNPPVVVYEWDESISKYGWFSALLS